MKMKKKTKNNIPSFKTHYSIEFRRYDSDDLCTFFSLDPSVKMSDYDLDRIVDICNQSLVYDFLFRKRLKGKRYTKKDAEQFIDWAKNGWKNKTHFVFLIKNPQGIISTACDIKSPDLESAEVGYWSSSDYPGVTTNATKILCDIAKGAGYKSLFGLVKPENEKSKRVLLRSEFEFINKIEKEGELYEKFEIYL